MTFIHITFMENIIDKLSNLITTSESTTDVYSLSYVDFDTNTGAQMLRTEGTLETIADTNFYDTVMSEYINNIREIGVNEFSDTLFTITIADYNDEIEFRKLVTKLKLASNYLATQGRIGPATHILISKSLHDKIKHYDIDNILYGCTIYVDSRIQDNEILLYRNNNLVQPGIKLIWSKNEDILKYKLVSVGLAPETQFLKINVN